MPLSGSFTITGTSSAANAGANSVAGAGAAATQAIGGAVGTAASVFYISRLPQAQTPKVSHVPAAPSNVANNDGAAPLSQNSKHLSAPKSERPKVSYLRRPAHPAQAPPASNPEWGPPPDVSNTAGPHDASPVPNKVLSDPAFKVEDTSEGWENAMDVVMAVAPVWSGGSSGSARRKGGRDRR